MFAESGELRQVGVPEFIVFHQGYEEPEGVDFRGMPKEGPGNEIHALHIP